jgi:hypothetical protein
VGDRQRAVALGVHLHQPARLEARRDDDEIGSREHAVNDRLARRRKESDLTFVALRELAQRRLRLLVPVARDRHGEISREDLRQRRQQHIDALLVDEAPHEDEQRPLAGDVEAELGQQRPLAAGFVGHVFDIVAGRQRHIGRRVPHAGVDAVDDAAERALPVTQHAIELRAVLGGDDLLRVRLAHGGQLRGAPETSFEQVRLPIELGAFHREIFPGDAHLGQLLLRDDALVREVVDRQHRRGQAADLTSKVGHQRRRPIVRVEHLEGRPRGLALASELHGGTREGGEPGGVVRVVEAIFPVDAGAIEQPGQIDRHEIDAAGETSVVDHRLAPLPAQLEDEWGQLSCEQQATSLERGVAGHRQGHFVTEQPQVLGECRGDVGQAADLRVGGKLTGDVQDIHGP